MALSATPPGVSAALQQAVAKAQLQGESSLPVLLAVEPTATSYVENRVRREGGQVRFASEDAGFLTVVVPVDRAEEIATWPGVLEISPDSAAAAQSAGAVAQALSLSGSAALDLMDTNRQDMQVPAFTAVTGADGTGVTIAVVDTGVDPSVADLAFTTAGGRKIVDWQDFTGEGDVDTRFSGAAYRQSLYTIYGNYYLGSIRSLSGRYHYGLFDESRLPSGGPLGGDINRNSRTNDTFGVLVIDQNTPGVYDTVYIDTNKNHNFADEIPLHVYRSEPSVAWLGTDNPGTPAYDRVPVVATRVAADGTSVNIGFDGNGHGTHVAGVAAANGGGRTGLMGVAPGAKIVALKALGSDGNGTWSDIAEAMIYAAEHGADVISLSVATLQAGADVAAQTQLIRVLADRYGVVVVVAAGNNGPGLGTVLAPGDADHALTVGAYLSPAMWRRAYGLSIGQSSLWYFSAVGPRKDGSLAPNLVGPGVAGSTVPRWLDPSGYTVFDGTSMATPHVAGAAALLESAARARGIGAGWRSVERALELGAVPMTGYTPVEQGYGVVNVRQAWTVLAGGSLGPELDASVPSAYGPTGGLFARDYLPGSFPVRFGSDYYRTMHLSVSGGTDWVSAERPHLDVPPRSSRSDLIYLSPLSRPGLWSTFITANDPTRRGVEGRLLLTIAVPWDLSGDNSYWRSLYGEAPPGRYVRYFLRVPAGTATLDLGLVIPKSASGGYRGQASMEVFAPDGRLEYLSGVAGAGTALPGVDHTVYDPQPGVWEVVVYSSEEAARLGFSDSRWVLSAQAGGVFASTEQVQVISPADDQRTWAVVPLSLVNRLESMRAQLVAVGLGTGAPQTRIAGEVAPGEGFTQRLPYLATSSFLRVAVAEPSDPDASLSLNLYRVESDGRLHYVASARQGGHTPAVTLAPAPAGQYVAAVDGYGLIGPVTFTLDVAALPDRGQVLAQDQVQVRRWGERWQASAVVQIPATPGTYRGLILIHNLDDDSYVPVADVLAQKGGPEITAQVPPASAGQFIFSARSGAAALSGTASLNGRVFWTEGGRASFLANPPGAGTMIDIQMQAPGYLRFQGQSYLAASTGGPAGVFPWQGPGAPTNGPAYQDREEEFLRRKVLDQMGGP